MINNELTTKRKYELEQTIESNNDEFIEIDKSLSLSELIYLVEAFKMPYQEILDFVNDYDSKRYNAVIFADYLAEKYGVSRENIIKRVQDVRKISNYTKNIKDIGTSTYTISKNCFKNDYFSGKSDMRNYIDKANSILSDVVSQAGPTYN